VRWKAGSLLIGVVLLFNALTGLISRRADAEDRYRRSLEVTAALTAARLDASIAGAATTLSIVAPQSDLDRLSRALGMPVCAVAEQVTCFQPPGTPRVTDDDGFVDDAIGGAIREIRSGVAPSRPVAIVAAPGDDVAASAIVVAVEHDDRLLVAVIVVAADTLMPAPIGARNDSFATPLVAELSGQEWWVRVSGDGPSRLATRDRLSIASQLVAGALLVAGAVAGVARDHRRLRRRASTDSLTGLPNRTEFERRASRALADLAGEGRGACLIVIDLDRFKAINDTIGHAAGDRVLRDAGMRLAGAVRSSDLVGRWGGDEFVLLLAGISDPLAVPERTAALAECLKTVPGAAGSGLTASVGAAVFPSQGRDLATLLDVADRAMYEAKPRPAAHGEHDAPAVPWRRDV